MRKYKLKSFTRRVFGSVALGGTTATFLAGARDKQVTQASVPGDPVAPENQEGTVPDDLPFDGALQFRRADVMSKVQPFAMEAVRLLPGPFEEVQEANRQFLHRLPVNRLVHTFRLNAGLASDAEPLGGWEKPDCELRGHFVGHYLSACALMYASTGDVALKAKGGAIVAHLSECQTHLGSGYLSAFPIELFDRLNKREKVWAPFYTVHKIMAGMFDMYQLCGNQQALAVLKGMADWADRWTSAMNEEHMQMVLDTEYGGMNEVLYNLAAATGEPHYAMVGDRFTKKRFFNPLALRRDELRGLHTNTHIPQVIGAARRYELSGDQRFHDVADYFWREVVETRTYVTGGTSNNEGWLVEPNRLAQELSKGKDSNECCCAYNMMKLSRMLYTWTANPTYFDYYERTLYNHRLGTINLHDGTTQYYLGVVPGSWRTFGSEYDSFWCCNGTGVEEYSKLNDSIYFHDADSIYVNLFIPSVAMWKAKGLELRQTNHFPEVASTEIAVAADKPTRFALHLRVPAWTAGFPTVKVNGIISEVSATPGSYVTLLRTWKTGDRVEIAMPMALSTESMPDDHTLQAVLYGPLVLAGQVGAEAISTELSANHMGPDFDKRAATGFPTIAGQGKPVAEWVTASSDLRFVTTASSGKTELIPFYKMGAGRRYSIYWKVV